MRSRQVSRSEVLRHVDSKRLVDLSMELANIESPTGYEKEVAEFYASRLKELGMRVTLQEVEKDRYNVVAILKGEGGGSTLMFNGHLDTSFSPREDPETLESISPGVYPRQPPWSYRRGDWLYGMGVFNMKSALAAYAAAVAAIQNSGARLKGDIIIAGVVGEIEKAPVDQYQGVQYRGYGYGTAYLVSHGGTADFAILGEPTGLRIMTAHFGSVWAKISLKGTLVHTAHSAGVTNVILQMNRIVSALEKWLPAYQERFSYEGVKPTVNVGSIEGGWPWRASRTPAFCNLYVDLRFPPRRHPLDVKRELEALLRNVKGETGIPAGLDLYVTDAWAEVPEDQYVVKAVNDAHREIFHRNVEHVVFSWSSDANVLTRHGIAAVNYGPSGGPGKERRGTMYIPNLVACAKVYALTALDICSQNRDSVRKPFS